MGRKTTFLWHHPSTEGQFQFLPPLYCTIFYSRNICPYSNNSAGHVNDKMLTPWWKYNSIWTFSWGGKVEITSYEVINSVNRWQIKTICICFQHCEVISSVNRNFLIYLLTFLIPCWGNRLLSMCLYPKG